MKQKMKYQQFIIEALNTVENKLTKVEMQFAYVVYSAFNVSIEEAVKISLEN